MRNIIALLLAVGATACGNELRDCDIREGSCRADVFYAVLEARGDPWDVWAAPPPSDVITIEELRALLLADLGPARPPDPWDEALALLELMEPDTTSDEARVDATIANVAAYYSRGSKTVTIVDRGESDQSRDTFVLAHEYVHAIQDRNEGLDATTDGVRTSDELFARTALIEGEAVVYSNLAMPGVRERVDDIDWTGYFGDWRAAVADGLAESTSRLVSGMQSFRYPIGGERLVRTYLADGHVGVRQLWREPPSRGIELVTPFGSVPPAADPLACGQPPAPPGHFLFDADVLGPVGVLIAATGRWLEPQRAWEVAGQWRADGIWTWSKDDFGGTVVVWRTRWPSEALAQEVAAAIDAHADTHDWRVERAGLEVTLAASDEPGLLDAWTGWRCTAP